MVRKVFLVCEDADSGAISQNPPKYYDIYAEESNETPIKHCISFVIDQDGYLMRHSGEFLQTGPRPRITGEKVTEDFLRKVFIQNKPWTHML
jgi:hypothetical protein